LGAPSSFGTVSDGIRRGLDAGPVPTEDFFDRLTSASSGPPPVLRRFRVDYPSTVKPKQDFSLRVSLEGFDGRCGSDELLVALSAPPAASVRTSDRCQSLSAPVGFSGACARPVACSVRLTWDVTPTDSGVFLFAFTLPVSLGVPTQASDWQGYAVDGTAPTWASVKRFSMHQPPEFYRHGISFEPNTQQLRIPVTVATTLGVTRSTYDLLAWLGTIISAILGTGWVWQAITVWRSRQRPSSPILRP
jgi:hypothetical protein